MELIYKNPFRIIGLLASSNIRDLLSRKTLIMRYFSVGRQVESDFDFPFLDAVERNENIVSQAFAKIEMNQDKINQSLFWFIKANNFDETALEYLKDGNREKALDIWNKVTIGKEVTAKNFSNFNNLGTLKLLGVSTVELKEGLELKLKLIESTNFLEIVGLVGDAQTYGFSTLQQTEKFLDDIIKDLRFNYTSIAIFNLFSNCSEAVRNYVIQKFTDEPIHAIEIAIEEAKSSRKANPREAYKFGTALHKETRDSLVLIERLLNRSHLKFTMISDNVAKEILQCGIESYTKGIKDESSLKSSIELLKIAKQMAINTITVERIDSNLKELENERYAEILKVLGLLRRLKEVIVDVNGSYSRRTLNVREVDQFLDKQVTDTIVMKFVKTDQKKYLDEFLEVIRFINKNINGAVINRINRNILNGLPTTHPFVISEKRRNEEELEKQRQQEIERKEKEEARKIKEKAGRIVFLYVLGFVIIVILAIGMVWGWGNAALALIIGFVILANLSK